MDFIRNFSNSMKVLAIIPARANSKGIKDKNIVSVGGRPLIVWTIKAAKKCKYIDRIVVSSDGDEILGVAERYGAEKLKRPASLAADKVRSELVIVHALRSLAKKGYIPDLVVYLQPTSPLRTAKHLDKALEIFKEKKVDALISVVKINNKILKAFVEMPDGFIIGISDNNFPFMNRQNLPSVFMPNGAIYIVKTKDFMKNRKFLAKRTIPFIMSAEDSIDVDTLDDIIFLEKMISKRHG